MKSPLYKVVMDTLVARIASGAMPPGSMLPSEVQLGQELGVAQGTARKALSELEARGLVQRVQGRGTFVTQRTTEDALFRFFRMRRRDGTIQEPTLISETIRERASKKAEREQLAGAPARVFEISRVRSLGPAFPFVEQSVVSTERFPGLKDRSPLPNTLYVFFQQAYSCMILRADESLSAALAGDDKADVLGSSPDAPVMEIRRRAFDALDQVVELRTMTCRTDTHAYFVSLT